LETNTIKIRTESLNSKQLALLARSTSENKKGVDPLILDIRKLTDFADFFVVVHGTSDRHVRTIADAIVDHLYTKKIKPLHIAGRNEATWILLDYGAVIVHVFHYETRKFYNLERLWGDAKMVRADHKHQHEKQTQRTRRSHTS